MHDLSHACDLHRDPLRRVDLLTHAPSSTTTSGPMTTSGPILHPWPILALGSYSMNNECHEFIIIYIYMNTHYIHDQSKHYLFHYFDESK